MLMRISEKVNQFICDQCTWSNWSYLNSLKLAAYGKAYLNGFGFGNSIAKSIILLFKSDIESDIWMYLKSTLAHYHRDLITPDDRPYQPTLLPH